jgi:hypothetical protein
VWSDHFENFCGKPAGHAHFFQFLRCLDAYCHGVESFPYLAERCRDIRAGQL